MSPNVGNFVHDLVEMAKAMETLPQVQAELDRAIGQIEEYAKQVQRLEMIAIERKAEIDNLHSRIRSLEVERDDASFRVLEAEDKAHNVLAMAKAARVSLDQITGLLDPPKPEPEPVQPPVSEVVQSIEPQSQGQGEGNPLPVMEHSQTGSNAPETTALAPSAVLPSGPYANKRYHDHPVYVSLWDWIDGGGTEESYRWAPSPAVGSSA